MRMRPALVSLVLGPVLGIVAACSSEDDGLNPQPLPPKEGQGNESPTPGARGGASAADANCTGTCCQKPAEGSACDTTEDTTCSWAVTCPTGLIIPYQITCGDGGAWSLTNGCPAEGASDSRGCPATQPVNGTPCGSSLPSQCGYVLDCKSYRKSAQATCINNGGQNNFVWNTTPLGTCD